MFPIFTHIQSIYTKLKNDILSTRGHSYCSKFRAKNYGDLKKNLRVREIKEPPGLLKSSPNVKQKNKRKFSLSHFISSPSTPLPLTTHTCTKSSQVHSLIHKREKKEGIDLVISTEMLFCHFEQVCMATLTLRLSV